MFPIAFYLQSITTTKQISRRLQFIWDTDISLYGSIEVTNSRSMAQNNNILTTYNQCLCIFYCVGFFEVHEHVEIVV